MDYQISPKNNNNTIFWIEVGKIKPNPQQPRREFSEEQLKELSESIKQYGILQPLLVVRKEEETSSGTSVEYELIAGERRLRAAKLAGLIQVPVIIRKEPAEKIKLEIALIENLQREDLNPLEKGRAFKQLSEDFNMKHQEIAEKIGKSRVYVTNTIRLLNLPEEIKASLREGKISEGHGRPLLMLQKKPGEQQKLYYEIMAKNLNVREAEKYSRRAAYERTRESENPFGEEIIKMENNLANILGTRVYIEKKGNTGKIQIDFSSADQLKSLFEFINTAKEKQIFKEEDNNDSFKEKWADKLDKEENSIINNYFENPYPVSLIKSPENDALNSPETLPIPEPEPEKNEQSISGLGKLLLSSFYSPSPREENKPEENKEEKQKENLQDL